MIEEFENGSLPSEEKWKAHIEQLRKKTVPSTQEEVKSALIDAVEKRIPDEKFGLLLSGGVDSSLLALILKKFTNNFICYCVGTSNSTDLKAAQEVAKALNLNLKYKEYSNSEIEQLLKYTKKILGSPDVPTLGVASVVVAAVELAKEDGINVFFGGLGSEEIFAGYHRHAKANNINEECWSGLSNMWKRDLVRDSMLGKKLNISVKVPFLDDAVIKSAMGISGERKINHEHKKIILREIAEELGLPHEFAWRQKKAAQYGSGFDLVMDKLAKRAKLGKMKYVELLS